MRLRAILALAFAAAVFARDPAQPRTLRELAATLSRHTGHQKFAAAQWGIKIVSLDSGAVLFETNANKLLKPASNAKIFTGALALDLFGEDFRIRTSLLAKQAPDERGVLRGDVIVYGRGDPSFAARFQDGSYSNLLGRIVESLRAAGVKEIMGDLVGDETFFSGPRIGASWTWDDLQYYYGAEVSSLSFQDNVVDLFIRPGSKAGEACSVSTKPGGVPLEFINRTRTTETNIAASINVHRPVGESRVYITGSLPKNYGTFVDAVTVPNPAHWFVQALRDTLNHRGIRVGGDVRTRSWPHDPPLDLSGLKEVAFTESPPMREIVTKMLKPSQNLYAQLLFLQAGARATNRLTEDAAVAALRDFAKRIGVSPAEVLLDEGSGLSRACLVTPNALAGVLRHIAKSSHADAFYAAFPAPGEGTMRSRFPEWRGDAGSRVALKAKTGSIRYVTTLSGYIRTAAGEALAFAIMLNAFDPRSGSGRDEVDFIVRSIARLGERTGSERSAR